MPLLGGALSGKDNLPGFYYVIGQEVGDNTPRQDARDKAGEVSREYPIVTITKVVQNNLPLVGVSFHLDRKSTRLNSSHANISYAVFCLKKKKKPPIP